MRSAYGGSILYVNLSDSSFRIEETPQLLKKQYLGGNGFGVKLVSDLVKPGIDPLSPDNGLVFAVGPATGTIIPCSSRFGVFSKSPLTGLFFDSYCGGTWGEQLKKAGFDALVIQGQAEAPISIVIDNYKVSFKRAVDLWGENTFNTQKKLLTQIGDGFTIATIGPAGENLVRYAGIISETKAAGRGGMGAVMGSKRLKAIAVRGNKDIEVQDPKVLMEYVYNLNERIKKHPGTGNVLPNFGTSVGAGTFNDLGILGSYNWQQETFKGAEKISGEYMKRKKIYRKTKACLHCPIRCSKVAKGRSGLLQEYVTDGPEFETVYSLGSLCGNDDINSIIAGDRICDELGLDTISAGAVLSFIMECHMRDILPSDVTDMVNQLGIRFGKLENIVKILYTIANREGIGDFLAEGTQRMADQLGDEAQKVCVAVKGLEISGHTARGLKGMGLGYAVATRGGTHQDARPTLERSGKYDPYTIEGKGKLI
ncbi:MAG: aldehyde ferredoxin oxidoreductase family protein, partial [Desulfitobacterium hafniense]|nr:aldehyde ferredoxin oxidoreductase family protein [Desulfitobacterium hafniense]